MVTGSSVTNAAGEAAFTYNGALGGTDTVRASVTTTAGTFFSNAVAVSWCASTLALAPSTQSASVGSSATVTATFADCHGAPISGVSVSFRTSGPNEVAGSSVTNAAGEASFTYNGAQEGTDTVQALVTTTTVEFVANAVTVSWTDSDLSLSGVPGDITTSATRPSGAVVAYAAPTPHDEAGDISNPNVSCAPASGSTFPIGTTTVTCTAADSDDANKTVTASFTVTVGYVVTLLYDPTKANKMGTTVPIKLQLTDTAGDNLSSSSISVLALCVAAQNATSCSSPARTINSPFTFMVLDQGAGYQYNLKTTGLTSGSYTLLYSAGNDPTTHSAPFMIA